MLGGTPDYSFVAGDTNSVLTVTCKRADTGAAINLSGATVEVRWSVDGATAVKKTMTVTDAPNGICTYTFLTGELVAGLMLAEVLITASGKLVTSLEPFSFTVRPALA